MFRKWFRSRRSTFFRQGQAEAVVSALYRSLLLRDPDPEGLAMHSAALVNGHPVEDLARTFLQSEEFYSRRGAMAVHYWADRPNGFFGDLSQNGEVSELIRAMMDATCENRILVDVGVRGWDDSNSHDLLRWLGWRGLLIEANAALNDQIRKDFGPVDYKLVNIAVSDYSGTATFHIGSTDGVSSLTEAHARQFGPTAGTVEVAVERLHVILQREEIPQRFGLLSIDIEGEDIKVLNDLIVHSAYRPNWIIFESAIAGEYRPGALPLDPRFDQDYIWAGKTAHNQIFRLRA
jgi:FkbM family methyltransferase